MRRKEEHKYFVYITTNFTRTVLYTGVTNDIEHRLYQHKEEARGLCMSFAGKYKCIYLVYYERFDYILNAIEREKQIKGWKRTYKENLISSFNPNWRFLNDEVKGI